jgi:hypothetical protein
MIKSLSVLFITLCAAAAVAQQPAPAKPTHNCVKPESLGPFAREPQQFKAFTRDMETYKNCMQKFAADQQEAAKAALEAGNAAVKEYNDFIAELNKDAAQAR